MDDNKTSPRRVLILESYCDDAPKTSRDALELARKVAHICGPQSAAAEAVKRYEEIKAAGHDTHMIYISNVFLVREPSDA